MDRVPGNLELKRKCRRQKTAKNRDEDTLKFDLEKIRESTGVASVYYEPVTESTNDWAIGAGRDSGIRMPALFLTSEQTRGRGRDGKTWISSHGSLTFSLLLSRPFSLNDARSGLVSLLTADAICETVEESCAVSPGIKWPNDVYLFDRKLAGVLIESAGATRLVIGCGVNVCNSIDSIPSAINLASILPGPPSVELILAGITRRIVDGLKAMATDSGSSLDAVTCSSNDSGFQLELLERCRARDWLLGRFIECKTSEGPFRGTSRGFSSDGSLIIDIGQGEQRVIRTGSVQVSESLTK